MNGFLWWNVNLSFKLTVLMNGTSTKDSDNQNANVEFPFLWFGVGFYVDLMGK